MSEAFEDFLNYFQTDGEGEGLRYPWDLKDKAIAASLGEDLPPIAATEAQELEARSQRFFEGLDNVFATGQTTTVTANLLERISRMLPRPQCLEILKVCQEKRDLMTDYPQQLTAVIAAVLPQWNGEDRAILMRSYAGAFRGGAKVKVQDLNVAEDWEAMSALDQAKSLVAIADLVLTELQTADSTEI